MRKLILYLVTSSCLCFAITTTAHADIIGAEPPLEDGTPDGWSGIPVMDGHELPPGQAVNVVQYYAADSRDFGAIDELYNVVPLIVQDDGGIYTVWDIGPTHTATDIGEQEFEWGSMEVPDDGNTYHPAALQWQLDVDNSDGGVIAFGEDGEGMFYFDVDTTDFVPDSGDRDIGEVEIGLEVTAGHSSGPGGRAYQLTFETGAPITVDQLQPGDADQNFVFDQLDLVKVQIAAKYLTGQAATWGEGDWDGAPGGTQGEPPSGDGLFDQLDIIAALNANVYLTGPYNAVRPGGMTGDGQTSVGYNASTGELFVDAPAGTDLTSINIDSAASIFTGAPAENLGGSFDNDADNNIFKATFGASFGSISFGNAAQQGLAQDFVLNDLTVVGSLAGGGDLGDVDLIYVPEPSTVLLLAFASLIGVAFRRPRRRP